MTIKAKLRPGQHKWPQSMAQLKRVTAARGYHYWSEDTVRFFESRDSEVALAGRVFYQSVQPPHGPRVYTVKLVVRSEQYHWAVASIGLVTEGTRSLKVCSDYAAKLASWVQLGLIPDTLEYGMDVALQKALGMPYSTGADHWAFSPVVGFVKEVQEL